MAVKNYFLLYVLFMLGTSCRRQVDIYTPADIATAQTMPPDMVFVKGDGNIPSFYMGVTEECNINHVIYENWLKRVYVDYPEQPSAAVPKNRDVGDLLHFNDPYYSYYQNHEAFAYYPIVGLSWLQAMNYLQWKSDRLNEKILFKIGVLDEEGVVVQTNEDNFNTEAYLSGYYEGILNERFKVEDFRQLPSIKYADGALFPTMRLPTEAEWDYAVATMPEKPINPLTYADPFSRKALYPFGKDYYTFIFGRTAGLEFDYFFKRGFKYHYKYDTIPATPDRLTGAGDFLLDEPGIANLAGNVPEWLLDKYAEEPAYKNIPFIDYFSEVAFPVLDNSFLYEDGQYFQEKDSLGKMSFYIYGMPGGDNNYLPFGRYQSLKRKHTGFIKTYYDSVKYNIVPDNYNTRRKSEIKRLRNIEKRGYTYSEKKHGKIDTVMYFNAPVNGYYVLITNSEDLHEYFASELLQKDSLGYFYREPQFEVYFPDTITHYRLIKGGSWKQPNTNTRQRMHEEEASPNVGFRAVITYPNIPLKNKKYRVKWR